MPCYYCSEPFQDHDVVVPLPLMTMERQEHGGLLAQDRERVLVHQHCLGDPDQ